MHTHQLRLTRICRALAFASAFASVALSYSSGRNATPRPNILFILADDLGYGDLGCYGAPDIRTPHLDRLATQGMRLTDFYANGATCSPTRYAFITGRYQQRGGLEYALYYQEMGAGLPPGDDTLASRLRSAGYATALIGKWHLGYDADRQPNRQGFEYFFGLLGGNHHYFTHVDRMGVPDLFLNEQPVERTGYSTDLFTDDALRYLREKRDRPFFLFLAYNAPHFPYQGPGDAARDVKPKDKSWSEGSRAHFVSMVESLDRGVGRVLAELDRLGLKDNTLVVFTSDNGGDLRGRNLPLRGLKGSLWEGGIRVPCIVRFPGRVATGRISDQPAITMDWTATLLALAGATKPALDGIDILPILNSSTRSHQERTLFWRRVPEPVRGGVKPQRAVREGRWKLVDHPDGPWHLFNLIADPGEKNDVAAAHPERCAQLQRKLDAWEQEFPANNPPATKTPREPIKKR